MFKSMVGKVTSSSQDPNNIGISMQRLDNDFDSLSGISDFNVSNNKNNLGSIDDPVINYPNNMNPFSYTQPNTTPNFLFNQQQVPQTQPQSNAFSDATRFNNPPLNPDINISPYQTRREKKLKNRACVLILFISLAFIFFVLIIANTYEWRKDRYKKPTYILEKFVNRSSNNTLIIKTNLKLDFIELQKPNSSTATTSPLQEFQQEFCDLNKRKLSIACDYDIARCNHKTLEYALSTLLDSTINKGIQVFNLTWTQNIKKYGLGQMTYFSFSSNLFVSTELLIYFEYEKIAPHLGFNTALPYFLSQQDCKYDLEKMLDFCYWLKVNVIDVTEYTF